MRWLLLCTWLAVLPLYSASRRREPPAVSVIVTKRGLDFVGDWMRDELMRFLGSRSRKLNLDLGSVDLSGGVSLKASRLNLRRFNRKVKGELTSLPGYGLAWTTKQMALDLNGPYETFQGGRRKKSGRARLKISGLRLGVTIGTEQRKDSLSARWDTCQLWVKSADLRVPQREKPLNRRLRVFRDRVRVAVARRLSDSLCKVLKDKLWPKLQPRIFNQPTLKPLHSESKGWAFRVDARPIEMEFEDGEVAFLYAGTFEGRSPKGELGSGVLRGRDEGSFGAGRPGEELPRKSSGRGAMVEAYFSPAVFASYIQQKQRAGQWDYVFLPDGPETEFSKYLATSCDSVCAGTFFPALEEQFPDSQLSVDAALVGDGMDVTLGAPDKIFFTGLYRVRIWVVTPSRARPVEFVDAYFKFTSVMEQPMMVRLDGLLEETHVYEDLTMHGSEVLNATSFVKGIGEEDVKFMISLVTDGSVKESIKRSLAPGAFVPQIFRFPLLVPMVSHASSRSLVTDGSVKESIKRSLAPGAFVPQIFRFPLLVPMVKVSSTRVGMAADFCGESECGAARSRLAPAASSTTTTTAAPAKGQPMDKEEFLDQYDLNYDYDDY